MIENKAPINGLSGSIKLGGEACRACDADAVLIALADMPRVTETHIYRLLDYADGADTILASSDGVRPRPPALFGKHRFDWLMSLHGDSGGRQMILKGQQERQRVEEGKGGTVREDCEGGRRLNK